MQKVLIIRFSSIGDIVLTTPVIRGLREQVGVEVHYLTKRAFRSIVAAHPQVSKVYSIDKNVREVLPQLQAEKYDLLIDLHRNLRSMQVKWSLSAKAVSFNKINLAKWLRVNLKVDRLPRRHIVERYLDPVRKFGVVYDDRGLDYYIPPEEEVDLRQIADHYLPGHPEWHDRCRQGTFIGLVIGAAHATKRLPPDKLVELARRLPKPVVLLGGQGDRQTGSAVSEAVEGVVNTCGDFSLHGSASLIRQCSGLITHDTGLMHIGAAFAKPMVSIWGNTIPEFGMYPLFPKGKEDYTISEVVGLSCRPCSKIGYKRCPKGHFCCMRNQPLDEVVGRAARF